MVYATEVKINLKDNQQQRLENIRKQREMEKNRIEKMQIFNYVKDHIVRGLIFNKHVVKYIRNKDFQEKLEIEKLEAEYKKMKW